MVNKIKKVRSLHEVSLKTVLPFISFPLLLYIFLVIIPIVWGLYYSFHKTVGWQMSWNGLENYRILLEDKIFWKALVNSFTFVLVSIVFQLGLALVLTTFFITKKVCCPKAVRAIFFFPCIISPIVISYIWNIMYSNRYGLLNELLERMGLGMLRQDWLADPNVIMTSISIPLAWQYIGFYLVILLAGVSAIDEEIFEVARLDGAKGMQLSRYIVMPLLKDSIIVSLVLCTSGGIKIFEQVYAISGGGPGYASTTLAQYAYQLSFTQMNYGYGNTVSIAMIVVSLVLVLGVKILFRNKERE